MEKHLKKKYGYNNFREYQKDIIEDVINGNDVFAILPTGGGKSLLYQFPATYLSKISIVISPLISLMNDQCLNLQNKNIKSICLNSENNISLLSASNILLKNSIIFVTPEYIINNFNLFENIIENICLFAIDEAHCISQWGHDFRVGYKKLNLIKDKFPNIPLLALTATATPKVLEDMHNFLNVEEIIEYNLGTRRNNLNISVKQKTHNIIEDLKINQDESTIIYVQTRKTCEKICELLNMNDIKCLKYHGGMSVSEKNKNHNLFVNDEIKVIVATVAFGMGIDKPDIRNIINYGCPSDIETYYQEIGRAGRDGIESNVTLFYNSQDFCISSFLLSKINNEEEKNHRMSMLNIIRNYVNEMNLCRQQIIDNYFVKGTYLTDIDVSNIPSCKKCDNCLRDSNNLQDITEDCQNVVELIKSLDYKLGISKIILILKGSQSSKIKFEKKNPLFGILKNKNENYIRNIINILITKNILQNDSIKSNYNSISYSVIKLGNVNLLDISPLKSHIQNTTKHKNKNKYELIRLKLSKKYNLKPYMIINDKILKNISDSKPNTIEELWLIDGVSQDFISTYGHYFLNSDIIITTNKQKTHDITYEMFNAGDNIIEIANKRNLSKQTIETHLIKKWSETKEKIDFNRINLNNDILNSIKDAIKIIGKEKLKPIKNMIPHISYFHIKLVLALFV